jgi:hypothetical protein
MIADGLYRWIGIPVTRLVFIWLLPVATLNALALNIG